MKERGDRWTSEVRRLLREDIDTMITTVKAQWRRESEMAARDGDEAPGGEAEVREGEDVDVQVDPVGGAEAAGDGPVAAEPVPPIPEADDCDLYFDLEDGLERWP